MGGGVCVCVTTFDDVRVCRGNGILRVFRRRVTIERAANHAAHYCASSTNASRAVDRLSMIRKTSMCPGATPTTRCTGC